MFNKKKKNYYQIKINKIILLIFFIVILMLISNCIYLNIKIKYLCKIFKYNENEFSFLQ